MSLEDLIRFTAAKPEFESIFNNAAQVWNHTFYWQSMTPKPNLPSKKLMRLIEKSFGSFDNCKVELKKVAAAHFASGWAWLVQEGDKLKIISTSNAETPITMNLNPLLVIDVWEHAYYLDFQNRRANYLDGVVDRLLNWRFASKNISS